jgi:hypothetical protein
MHEANNPFLAAALEYATCFGWHVFPVQPGRKEPATANGFLNATTDPDQIRAWWRSNPNANVGVVPGPSNLVILDLDKPVAKRLIEEYDIPDQFAWAATGKGDHLYLGRGQYEVKSHNWADIFGLDIRAETGYVVAPPSLHPEGGTYSWVHEPSNVLDTIPQRLRDLLTTLEKIQTWYRRYLNEGKVGNRNDIGSYVVQQLLDNRVPENVALILALHYQQTVRYQEGKGEYTEDEILATFRSTKLKPRRVAAFTSEDVGGFTPTDMGNARRFIARYGQQVRYNAVWAKWMYWTGYNWVIDEHQRARHMMQQIPKDIKAEMEKAQTDEIRDMLRKWLMRSEMHATQESSLLEAAKFPAVVAHPDDFDRDPWLLNTLSGVVDLHTGQTCGQPGRHVASRDQHGVRSNRDVSNIRAIPGNHIQRQSAGDCLSAAVSGILSHRTHHRAGLGALYRARVEWQEHAVGGHRIQLGRLCVDGTELAVLGTPR